MEESPKHNFPIFFFFVPGESANEGGSQGPEPKRACFVCLCFLFEIYVFRLIVRFPFFFTPLGAPLAFAFRLSCVEYTRAWFPHALQCIPPDDPDPFSYLQ